jgi:hypothetical protein
LAQPASSSSEVPETTSRATEADEAPLPDWSAPFVFPGQRTGEAASAANGDVPAPSADDNVAASSSGVPEEVPASEEEGKGKGKAKTVSVEEVRDDENA